MLLILLGNGVVANVLLKNTKGHGGGWLLINLGWGMAVFTAVLSVAAYSGAHLNPAVTVGLAFVGSFPWAEVAVYIGAQMLGAAIGALLVWIMYKDHYDITEDEGAILGTFATGPQIRNPLSNLISEILGTFVLVFAVLYMVGRDGGAIALDALPVGLVVVAIGISLGGTTGYAINPARDLGPRIMHAMLPIGNKGSSDWGYSWIPIVGPIVGALLAGGLYMGL